MRPRFFATSHAGFDAFSRRLSAFPSPMRSGRGPVRSRTMRLSRSIFARVERDLARVETERPSDCCRTRGC